MLRWNYRVTRIDKIRNEYIRSLEVAPLTDKQWKVRLSMDKLSEKEDGLVTT